MKPNENKTYAQRVAELEAQGLTTSDAQAVVDVQDMTTEQKGYNI